MRKEFNITDSCNPQWHYMVNTEERFKAVKREKTEPQWIENKGKQIFEVTI